MTVQRWTLSGRLLTCFGAVCALAVLQAAIGYWTMRSVDASLDRLAGPMVSQSARINALDVKIVRASLEARQALLARTPAEKQEALDRIGQMKREADELMAQFEASVTTEGGRKRFAEVKQTGAAFWAVAAQDLLPRVQAGDVAGSMELLTTSVVPARNAFLEAIQRQQDWQAGLVQEVALQGKAANAMAEWVMIVSALAVLALGAGLALWLAGLLRRQLGGEPEDAVQAVQAIAAGDLTHPVQVRAGDTTSILAAVADMRDRLAALVSQVRQGIDSVATASREIATGNADLSSRTEQQAAGLQQTAASMQQMTSSVRSNADSARQANQMAVGARDAAQRGGEVVGKVVTTMGDIQTSSRKIADIIGTIDGIAFQTNILALNAAVEAARAGEQGRGFAVVAAEVRSLAGRSAEAAKQIKALIGASVETVDNGHQLVADAGRSMGEIVAQVQRVTDLIGEITSASEEQTRGIDQVGAAVQQIDQGTQQNAALVEQSAAAAESLKVQAAQLAQAVAVFRVTAGPVTAQ
jgi:methyl-accepting chemotaxis protein